MEDLGLSSDGSSQSMSAEKENIAPIPGETSCHGTVHAHTERLPKGEAHMEARRESWDSSEHETPGFESESPNSSDESCQEEGFVPTSVEDRKWSEEARVLAQVTLSELSLGEEVTNADKFNLPSAGSRDSMDPNDTGACHDTKVKNITMAKKMLLRSELRNSSSTSENAGSCSVDSRKPAQPRHGKHGRHGGGRGSNPRHPPQRRPRGKHRRSGCHHGGRPGWHNTRESPPPPPPPPPPSRKRGSNSSQNFADPARRPVGRLEPQVEVCVLNLLQALSDCYGDMATSLIPQSQVRPHRDTQYASRLGGENCAGSTGPSNINVISIPSQATTTATNPYAGYLPVLAQNASGAHVPAWIPADLVYSGGGAGGSQEGATTYQHLAFQHGYYDHDGGSRENLGGRGGEVFRE